MESLSTFCNEGHKPKNQLNFKSMDEKSEEKFIHPWILLQDNGNTCVQVKFKTPVGNTLMFRYVPMITHDGTLSYYYVMWNGLQLFCLLAIGICWFLGYSNWIITFVCVLVSIVIFRLISQLLFFLLNRLTNATLDDICRKRGNHISLISLQDIQANVTSPKESLKELWYSYWCALLEKCSSDSEFIWNFMLDYESCSNLRIQCSKTSVLTFCAMPHHMIIFIITFFSPCIMPVWYDNFQVPIYNCVLNSTILTVLLLLILYRDYVRTRQILPQLICQYMTKCAFYQLSKMKYPTELYPKERRRMDWLNKRGQFNHSDFYHFINNALMKSSDENETQN